MFFCGTPALPQSVIITGESGAGKSEACKLVLQFIADLSAAHSGRTVSEDEQSLEQQLLQVQFNKENESRSPHFTA